MKVWQLCEMDVGDHSNIVHGTYYNKCNAEKVLEELESNPCDVSFYVVESEYKPGMKMEDSAQILSY